jgi:hypothetical protein
MLQTHAIAIKMLLWYKTNVSHAATGAHNVVMVTLVLVLFAQTLTELLHLIAFVQLAFTMITPQPSA